MKRIALILAVVLVALTAYLSLWPVPIDPVCWKAPTAPGYTGVYAVNDKLAGLKVISLGVESGPEHIVLAKDGKLYAAVTHGNILRMNSDGTAQEVFVNTGGRVLGFDFDATGNLIAADAHKGLLSISPDRRITILANKVGDDPIRFADAVVVAANGKIYFSDASTRFAAIRGVIGSDTVNASLLDVLEQSATGRILEYDPAAKTTRIVVTVDKDFSIQQAVDVKNERIIAVGRSKDIQQLTVSKTRVIDLKGKTVLPGLNDAHTHFLGFGLSRPPAVLDVGSASVKSIAEIAVMVGKRAKEVKPGEWISGSGWDEGYLKECLENPGVRHPTRWDIDRQTPDNPVCLVDFSGHNTWCNSKALELAKVTKNTPDPIGGEIVRDSKTGEPTGFLKENAQPLVRSLIPPPSKDQQIEALTIAMREMTAMGVTSITDASVSPELWSLKGLRLASARDTVA